MEGRCKDNQRKATISEIKGKKVKIIREKKKGLMRKKIF